MTKLTTQKRQKLPARDFAIPSERAYPIQDIAHARNALARVAQHGTPAEKMIVSRAVLTRYPTVDMPKKGSLVRRSHGEELSTAFADWNRNDAYVDSNGNYRVKIPSKPIAPWNGTVKLHYGKDVTAFHNDAHKFHKNLGAQRESINQLRQVEADRSLRARAQDESRANQATYPHTDRKAVEEWLQHPGRVDILGVDSPRKTRVSGKRGISISQKMPKLK